MVNTRGDVPTQPTSGSAAQRSPATAVCCRPLLQTQSPQVPMSTKMNSSFSHASALAQPGEVHGGTRSQWDECSRVASGAAAVEGTVLSHRRDRTGMEDSGLPVHKAMSSSGPSVPVGSPRHSHRGGNGGYRRAWACSWVRCSRAWFQMGSIAQPYCKWLPQFSRRRSGCADALKGTSRQQEWQLGRRELLRTFICIVLLLFGFIMAVLHVSYRPHVPSWNGTLSILVQHEDAPQRMQLGYARKVKWVHLPSWTLRVVPAHCKDCLDKETYKAAVQHAADGLRRMQVEGMDARLEGLKVQQPSQRGGSCNSSGATLSCEAHNTTETTPEEFLNNQGGPYAVFANIGAPLGKIGPMLLAMSSLTDGVDVAAELPHWHWLKRTRIFSETSAVRLPPYVAVMGIPSVDAVRHSQLRDAQRSTWKRYTDVARSANSFQGRLLPLYIFAAPAHIVARDPTWVGQDEDIGLDAAAELYRPTVKEFADASNFYRTISMSASGGLASRAGFSYRQRRMFLRPEWRTSDLNSSPCSHVTSSIVHGGAGYPLPPLAVLAAHLRLPVTPAFTAVARFLCEASSGLWLEALQHRDALWIDIVADQNVETTAQNGDRMSKMAAAVGTTQKTVLWLEYAYHAFPHVPFIVKGDDSTYIKVPQLMSDFVYMLSGLRHRNLTAERRDGAGRAPAALEAVERAGGTLQTGVSHADDTSYPWLSQFAERECVYWGLLAGQSEGVLYFTGMHYSMTRKVARIVLERPRKAYGTENLRDVALIAMFDFNSVFADIYTDVAMTEEDRFIGTTLHDRRARVAQLCSHPGITYVEEPTPRFHALRRDVDGIVTWASVVIHHCTPASMRFLHNFYFLEEHRVGDGVTPAGTVVESEKAAREREAQWIRKNANVSLGPGWDDLPTVLWVPHRGRSGYTKAQIMFLRDGVAVYNTTFTASNHAALQPGWPMMLPHVKKGWF
ncbi:uncharacterized protein JKF63_08005 [Porcisia hertigi]|uniref:Phosphoglycan beta 1,3 galactosyltransferase n=1 Tax=Porcisia hertigi TaxID=2761500 RepID=A0A836HVI0_9TRYP|nr:hypothetical protein JKF63_08005 [Porcisia hertigi]